MRPINRVATAFWLFSMAAGLCAGQTPALTAKISDKGLTSLFYDGHEFLAPAAAPGASLFAPEWKQLPFEDGGDRLKRSYDGLTIETRMRQEKDALELTVTYTNTGGREIAKIDDQPFAVHFPKRPLGGSWKWGYASTVDTDGAPAVCVADFGVDKLLVCVEDATRPMRIGFAAASGFGAQSSNGVDFQTIFKPGLAPGKQWTFHGSLRFAPTATPSKEVVPDIYAQFLKAFPFRLDWPDRRPVGMISLAQAAMHWPKNPRGYFGDPSLDVTTPAGRRAFRERLMRFGDRSIAEIKRVGAQGMIFWDVEGQQMPHAISYLGDPRVLPREAPEMDAVADEFFKKFLDAGLRTGVCIRPSRVIPDSAGGWQHTQVEDPVSEMAAKIAYARKRWGCTLIYMDTNVRWPPRDDPTHGMWQGDATILPAADIVELARRSPGVLIFPEAGQIGYHSVAGEYTEGTGTPDEVRIVYPRAASLVCIKDSDVLATWDIRLKGAMAGDMELFRGWFADTANTQVKGLYEEADFLKREPPGGAFEDLVRSPEPLARFTALHRLRKPDSAQVTLLLAAARKENDWLIQREMVLALGRSDDPRVESVFADVVRNPAGDLGEVAAPLLGRFRAATPMLVKLAVNRDPHLALRALRALAQNDDPAATPALIKLADSPDPWVRPAAVRALGKRDGAAVTAKLLSILQTAKDTGTLREACDALGRTKDPAMDKPLLALMNRALNELHDNDVRQAASDALESITGLQIGPFEDEWKRVIESRE